jgi:hypothetical protein
LELRISGLSDGKIGESPMDSKEEHVKITTSDDVFELK